LTTRSVRPFPFKVTRKFKPICKFGHIRDSADAWSDAGTHGSVMAMAVSLSSFVWFPARYARHRDDHPSVRANRMDENDPA
jgi:hypothetical protein